MRLFGTGVEQGLACSLRCRCALAGGSGSQQSGLGDQVTLVIGPEHLIPRGPQEARGRSKFYQPGCPKAQRPRKISGGRDSCCLSSITPCPFPVATGRQGATPSPVASGQFHTPCCGPNQEKEGPGLPGAGGATAGGAPIRGAVQGGKDRPQCLASHHPKSWRV